MTTAIDKQLTELVGTFADPIIVHLGGWGDSLPDWIRGEITLERLVENMRSIKEADGHKGTDAEAVAYLYTASLTAPMTENWTRIYLYVASKEMAKHGTEVPDDIKVESLSDYELGELNKLKSWIYDKRVKARKERAKQERQSKPAPDTEQQTEPCQLAFALRD